MVSSYDQTGHDEDGDFSSNFVCRPLNLFGSVVHQLLRSFPFESELVFSESFGVFLVDLVEEEGEDTEDLEFD